MTRSFPVILAGAAALLAGEAVAEPVAFEVLLEPKDHMRFDFSDGTDHLVAALRREGTADGSGAFAGATVIEFGWHDVNPPFSGQPQGYLQLTMENGDVAVLAWSVQATFVAAEDGPALINSGSWELVKGTGQFAGRRGVGTVRIEPEGGPGRFILAGEIGATP